MRSVRLVVYPGGWPLRVRVGRVWLALGAWPEIQKRTVATNRYMRMTRDRWKVHGLGFKFVWDRQGVLLKRGASFSLEYRRRPWAPHVCPWCAYGCKTERALFVHMDYWADVGGMPYRG